MSCLFNTLSKFVDISSDNLRQNICNYLQDNPKLFEDISAEQYVMWSNEGYNNINEYIQRMRSTSTWGGAIEIKVFCNLYNKKVVVLGRKDIEKIEFLPKVNEKCKDLITIHWNGGHYWA